MKESQNISQEDIKFLQQITSEFIEPTEFDGMSAKDIQENLSYQQRNNFEFIKMDELTPDERSKHSRLMKLINLFMDIDRYASVYKKLR